MIKNEENYKYSDITEKIIKEAYYVYNNLEAINKIFEVQLLNYLKATNNEVGLLINFGPTIVIKRKVFRVNYKKSEKSELNSAKT